MQKMHKIFYLSCLKGRLIFDSLFHGEKHLLQYSMNLIFLNSLISLIVNVFFQFLSFLPKSKHSWQGDYFGLKNLFCIRRKRNSPNFFNWIFIIDFEFCNEVMELVPNQKLIIGWIPALNYILPELSSLLVNHLNTFFIQNQFPPKIHDINFSSHRKEFECLGNLHLFYVIYSLKNLQSKGFSVFLLL